MLAITIFACIIFQCDDQYFLLKRSNAGFADGMYDLVSGRVNSHETMTEAAAREAFEEVGVVVQLDDLQFCHVVHEYSEGKETLGFCFIARRWSGQLYNKEPHKHSEAGWYAYDALPKNTQAIARLFIEMSRNNAPYSEHGWVRT